MDEPFRADHLATLMSASPDEIFQSDPCHMTVRCASRALRQLAWRDAENKEGREDSGPLLSAAHQSALLIHHNDCWHVLVPALPPPL